jgi:hypothetical protein
MEIADQSRQVVHRQAAPLQHGADGAHPKAAPRIRRSLIIWSLCFSHHVATDTPWKPCMAQPGAPLIVGSYDNAPARAPGAAPVPRAPQYRNRGAFPEGNHRMRHAPCMTATEHEMRQVHARVSARLMTALGWKTGEKPK